MADHSDQPDEPEVGIVLAAGGSSRMGRPKALLTLDGRPLLLHHLDALGRVCPRLRVVTGAHDREIARVLPSGVERVHNPRWSRTHLRDSLLLALADLDVDMPVVVTPVDAPPASPTVLAALASCGPPAVPAWQGQDGHPVLARTGDLRRDLATGTLRDAMARATRAAVDDPDVVCNLNRPAQWEAWRARRSASS